jgi:hypothetical protein
MRWQDYEQGLLGLFQYRFRPPLFRVEGTQNGILHRVKGLISMSLRQLDAAVYIGSANRPFLIGDAKRHDDPIGSQEVELCLGLMEDVGARLGYIAAPASYKPAHRRGKGVARVVIMSLADAGRYRWLPAAASIYPSDWVFHEQLAGALSTMHEGGRPSAVIAALEGIAYEEWEAFSLRLLTEYSIEGEAFLTTVARYHFDDGWVYNAARLLREHGLMTAALRKDLRGRNDPELDELLST